MSNASKLIQIAKSQLGVAEDPLGHNSGTQVNEYLKSVNHAAGAPWCMAFVYWCHLHAGIQGVPKTASVSDFYKQSLNLGKAITFSILSPGDVVLRVNYPALPGGTKLGNHAGIYTGLNSNKVPLYISGNTPSTTGLVADKSDSYVDEHTMKYFNYVVRFC
ncbi:hypothetical protein ACI2JR_22925 [Klebsiella sp. NPDC088457]